MDLILELVLQAGLVIGFAALAFVSLRIAADAKRAASLSTRAAMQLSGMPSPLRGDQWAYSPTALRFYALDVSLASLNFVLIGLHLTPLVFVSVACLLVSFLVISAVGFRHLARQTGTAAALFRDARPLELLVLFLIFLYTVGVLVFAKAVLT